MEEFLIKKLLDYFKLKCYFSKGTRELLELERSVKKLNKGFKNANSFTSPNNRSKHTSR